MESAFTFLPVLAPLALAGVAAAAILQPGPRPRWVLLASRLAGAVVLAVAAGTVALVAANGPTTSPLLGGLGLGLSLRLDALSAAMFAMVALLGVAVLEYGRRYLDGDPRHGAFLGNLALTVAAVMLLVTAGNLGQLVGAWVGTSLALHRLLLFYPERPAAVRAARKKFVSARFGDVLLVIAAAHLAHAAGTADIGELLTWAGQLGSVPANVQLAAVLLVLTAALKSAQFPTHGWLVEVMETPTPVSALLHAGVLNAGVFLLARLGEVIVAVPAAQVLLVVIGGVTAVFASVAMTAQSGVKTALAYSSAAHMGFSTLVCGLGAFPVAILHLVGHSFYKAHAFLSAGSAVEVIRAARLPGVSTPRRPLHVIIASGLAVAIVAAVALLLGVDPARGPVELGLAATLALGLTFLVGQGVSLAPLLARTLLLAGGTAVAFFVLEGAASRVLGASVPAAAPASPVTLALLLLVGLAFAAVIAAQLLLPTRALQRLRVHLRGGLYAAPAFDRLVHSWRGKP